MNKNLLLFILIISIFSCKKYTSTEEAVYNNNFETSDLNNITRGATTKFNGSTVLGNFNNNNVAVTLNNLTNHDLVTISFDLYIHDNWIGNTLSNDQPELWQMLVDGNPYINTTFSNLACGVGTFCPPQSYPLDYPNSNHNPKAGAYRTDLPGFCAQKTNPNGTTQYKIVKTITHSGNKLILNLLDQGSPINSKCDKSWSIDNLVIKTVKL